MQKYIRYKPVITICIGSILAVFLFLLGPILGTINISLYESYFRIKNTFFSDISVEKIIVVDIDDASLEAIGNFPFSRSLYSEAIENLQVLDPATIAFDLLFLDPSDDKDADEKFINTVQKYDNIVLGAALRSDETVSPPFFEASYGHLPPRVNTNNNTVYSFVPYLEMGGDKVSEHFTIGILRKYYYHFFEDEKLLETGSYGREEYIFSDDISYPLSRKYKDDILINFLDDDAFSRLSFYELLDSDTLNQSGVDFQDAVVLIGPAAEGFGDYFFTPNGREFGLNIHAHILSTLIKKDFITYFDLLSEWIYIFLIIILSLYVNLSDSRLVIILGNFAIICVFWILIPVLLILFSHLIFTHPAEIIFSLIFAFSAANIIKYVLENINKKKLGSALSEYVGSSIADEILLEHGKVNLDGERREVVCFFSDIEGFTNLSEKLEPEALVSFLREYLAEMTSITMENSGHVDKFEGDAIMSLWGAFSTYKQDDCVKACHTALEQQKAVAKLSKKYKKDFGHELFARIGIHEGEVIIGNIGAAGKKMEFTALGDTVNLASRLEGVNKYYGTYICVSHQIHEATKDTYGYRFLDEIRVKGKNKAIKIYELLGYKHDLSEPDFEHYMKFSRALGQYRKGNFQEAQTLFEELERVGDAPSEVFVGRCKSFIQYPPQGWDGIWTMDEK